MTQETTKALAPLERAAQVMKLDETKGKLQDLALQSVRIEKVDDADSRAECHAALMRLRDVRVGVEKRGKDARADATAFNKAVIKVEDELVEIIAPEEKRLRALRDDYDDAIRRELEAAAAAEQKRLEDEAAAKAAAEKAEADRIAKEREDALAAERVKLEQERAALEAEKAEQARQAAERERVEREQREAADAAQREALRKEREAFEAQQAEERARLQREREALERAQAEQRKREQERLDAEAKAAREEADRKAAEARAQAQRDAEAAYAARLQGLKDAAPSLLNAAIAAHGLLVKQGLADNDITITLGFAIDRDAPLKEAA